MNEYSTRRLIFTDTLILSTIEPKHSAFFAVRDLYKKISQYSIIQQFDKHMSIGTK